jgi:hypothetical protein
MQGDEERRRAVLGIGRIIERKAKAWTDLYRLESDRWRLVNTSLTILAAALAATSAGAGLARLTTPVVAGLAALAAAVVSTVNTALGASGQASRYESAAAAGFTLADDAEVFCATVAPYAPLEQVMERFERLCEQRRSVVQSAPMTVGRWARRQLRRTGNYPDFRALHGPQEPEAGSGDVLAP